MLKTTYLLVKCKTQRFLLNDKKIKMEIADRKYPSVFQLLNLHFFKHHFYLQSTARHAHYLLELKAVFAPTKPSHF
jgi:hypothetical protein